MCMLVLPAESMEVLDWTPLISTPWLEAERVYPLVSWVSGLSLARERAECFYLRSDFLSEGFKSFLLVWPIAYESWMTWKMQPNARRSILMPWYEESLDKRYRRGLNPCGRARNGQNSDSLVSLITVSSLIPSSLFASLYMTSSHIITFRFVSTGDSPDSHAIQWRNCKSP